MLTELDTLSFQYLCDISFQGNVCLNVWVPQTPSKDVSDLPLQLHLNFHFVFGFFFPFPQLAHTVLPGFYRIEEGKGSCS